VTLENGIAINDCELHVENMIFPNTFSVLMVQYDPTRIYVPGSLEKIKYVKQLSDGAVLNFVDNDLLMAFNFEYYSPDLGDSGYPNSDNVPSGAYIFKPAKGKQASI
jgi:hypothetical protein